MKITNLFRSWNVILGLSVLLLLSGTANAHNKKKVLLIEKGKPRAAIVLSKKPVQGERAAADELIDHLKLMTGIKLQVTTDGEETDGLLPIYIGAAADKSLDKLTRAKKNNPSSFTLKVTPERIDLRGLSDEGTRFAVYELLEQIGFRWYIPGDLGCVVPTGSTVQINIQENTQVPSMDLRLLQPWPLVKSGWTDRMRLGGDKRPTGSHGLPELHQSLFDEHPELFSLVNAERRPQQICISNPEALRRVVMAIRKQLEHNPDMKYIGMGPNDGRGYCECEDCRALDGGVNDPFYEQESMTDRYVWFFNRVLDEMEDEHPELHIVFYAYALHMFPPKAVKPNPRIVPVFAPITLDRIRGMDNPMSPDRHVFRYIIDAWAELKPNEMYYRGYYNNLACPNFPKTQLDLVRNEIPVLYQKGINVMRGNPIRNSWASDPITLYVAARLMWNVDTDVDALLAEFYKKYYGPAEEPMKAYHKALESAFADTPYFTGSSYIYFPIFHKQRRDNLRGLLEKAAALAPRAGEGHYGERIWAIRQGFRRLELFLDMTEARNAHNFATAHEKMQEYYDLSNELSDYELEIYPDTLKGKQPGWDHRLVNWVERSNEKDSYFNRFFRDPVVNGYQRTEEIGDLVAALSDQWDFLIDPAEIGEMAGYQRPGELGGNWQAMKTSSRSWSDQGLHYYKGVAWYRTSVKIPAKYSGRPIYLWFGGVDEVAYVWINGEFIGTSREPNEGLPGIPGTFRSFDMPATKVSKPGKENWVVVKIVNEKMSELGTGGIVAPVMFWSPRDSNWNPRD